MTNDVHFTSPAALESAFVGAMETGWDASPSGFLGDLADSIADNVVGAIWQRSTNAHRL